MATEILGFLIIVGILIVFIVRRDLWNGTSSKADEVEEASVKMRLQMEHSANAIITQMDSRIHQLEGLVNAADERARVLEQQLAAVRADQERAQQQAERAFAEMRAARASYYASQEELTMPSYHDGPRGGAAWSVRDEYRGRTPAAGRSLRPIEGVAPVHRSEYVPRVRPESRGAGADFAETLSASMYAEESGNGAYRRTQADYYGNGQSPVYEQSHPRNGRYPQEAEYSREDGYDGRVYGTNYAEVSYPVEMYPEEENGGQYVEQPRRTVSQQRNLRARPVQTVPAEMAVEETPAVIVDSKMVPRQDAYVQAEPENEEPAFSPEQLAELARTEAEVVVSSSVADVVDLPYDAAENEDVHAFAETDDGNTDAQNFTDDRDLAETEAEQDDARPGRFEEQDLFGEESEPVKPDREGMIFAASEEEFSETAEDVPDEAESFGAEEDVPPETVKENESFESDEEMWDDSPEAPVDHEETLAGGMNETLEEDDYETPEHTSNDSREEEISPRQPSPTIRARELLAQGMPPEEVAKETGMGRSAVELLAQMAQGQLNSQEND